MRRYVDEEQCRSVGRPAATRRDASLVAQAFLPADFKADKEVSPTPTLSMPQLKASQPRGILLGALTVVIRIKPLRWRCPVRITAYKSGHIELDGKGYDRDLVITPETVRPNWWRKQGHSLASEDLDWVISAKPEAVVIGQGYSSCMDVPDETIDFIKQHGAEVIVMDTTSATKEFNRLVAEGKRVVAALHLTC